MEQDSGRLQLFLSQGEERDETALRDGLPKRALASSPELALSSARKPFNFFAETSNPNALKPRGWGLVVPRDEGLRKVLLDAIWPLVELRAAQLQCASVAKLLEENVYVADADPLLGESGAKDWLRRVYTEEYKPAEQRRPAHRRPQYLLVLGDLHQVAETISRALAQSGCFVGRLAFSDESGSPQRELYRRYAEKVRAAEDPARLSPAGSSSAGIYGVVDGTAATDLGYQQMILPMHARARQPEAAFRARQMNLVNASQLASRDELWSIAEDLPNSVLFTMSHGYGGPEKGFPDARVQRRRQGAMSFLGGEPRLTAEAAESMQKPFLKNGIWFMFACYGAGTPSRSHFHHWLKELPPEMFGARGVDWVKRALPAEGGDHRPFVAALPTHLLAREEGPLAFIGHLDLAWGYSFQTTRGGSDPDPFVGVMRDLLKGSRIGVAFSGLMQKRNKADGDLLAGYNRRQELKTTGHLEDWSADEELRKQESWMTRQDLSGYVILGDPAARLPLQVKWTNVDEDDESPSASQKSEEKSEAKSAEKKESPNVPNESAPITVQVPVRIEAASEAAAPSQFVEPSDVPAANVAISPALAALPLWRIEELLAEVILGELGPAALGRKYGLTKREVEKIVGLYRAAGRARLLSLLPDWDRD